MIQRIQTIFLLLTAILMGATFFFPMIEVVEGQKAGLELYSCGFTKLSVLVKPTYGILFFAALAILTSLINIFLYKKRKLQIKIGWLTAVLIVLFYVTAAVYFISYTGGVAFAGKGEYAIQFGIILPFIAFIFNLLAIFRIKKDEKLVKSLDRIR